MPPLQRHTNRQEPAVATAVLILGLHDVGFGTMQLNRMTMVGAALIFGIAPALAEQQQNAAAAVINRQADVSRTSKK